MFVVRCHSDGNRALVSPSCLQYFVVAPLCPAPFLPRPAAILRRPLPVLTILRSRRVAILFRPWIHLHANQSDSGRWPSGWVGSARRPPLWSGQSEAPPGRRRTGARRLIGSRRGAEFLITCPLLAQERCAPGYRRRQWPLSSRRSGARRRWGGGGRAQLSARLRGEGGVGRGRGGEGGSLSSTERRGRSRARQRREGGSLSSTGRRGRSRARQRREGGSLSSAERRSSRGTEEEYVAAEKRRDSPSARLKREGQLRHN